MRPEIAALCLSVIFPATVHAVEPIRGHAGNQQKLEPSERAFNLAGRVLKRNDVSAVAQGDGPFGILVSDEGATVQILEFSRTGRGAFVIGYHLLDPLDVEIDFEAATFMEGWFYVSGSHGAAKVSGEYNPERARIYRFRIDEKGQVLPPVEQATFAAVFDSLPELAPYHRQPLQARGINIEGLSARDGRLYLGLRSPNIDGHALVLEVHADELFSRPRPKATVFKLPMGEGLGIRAMTAHHDGFLLIAGNAGSEPSTAHPVAEDYLDGRPSQLFFWSPNRDEVLSLGEFPQFGKGKEEAIISMKSPNPGSVDIVVMYDSLRDGEPRRYTIALPEQRH